VGCRHTSRGCENCWAERLAGTRLAHLPEYKGLTDFVGRWTGIIRFLPERLVEPLRKRKPSGIFVCDMGDLFHQSVTDEQIAAVYGVMAACPHHRFYVLTKRAKRRREWFEWAGQRGQGRGIGGSRIASAGRDAGPWTISWPLLNVFEGTSIEDQATADERIPELLQTPAAVRWVSYEPALERVVFRREWISGPGALDWIVLGCESGPGARPMPAGLAEDLIQQLAAPLPCKVALFYKQAMVLGRLDHEPMAYGRTWREMPKGDHHG
jgi:protein gp37